MAVLLVQEVVVRVLSHKLKMKKFLVLFSLCFIQNVSSQNSLQELLKKYNQETVPYMYINDLKKIAEKVILLDAREQREFEISHINNATHVGYNNFNLKKIVEVLPKDKNSKIVVYCSLGIRSEDVAEQIKKAGFTNVFNLYGGIFEWKNYGNKIYSSNNKPTEKVHVFDKEWDVWLKKGIKIYE